MTKLNITKTMLADLIYDKLMNNTDYPQFEPEMAEEAELVYKMHPHEFDYISITINGKEYRLNIEECDTIDK